MAFLIFNRDIGQGMVFGGISAYYAGIFDP